MARGPFPTGDFGSRTSGGLPGGNVGAPGAGAAAELGQAARRFGRELRDVADRAYVREGQADAARAITAAREFGQEAALRPGQGVDDQAYNTAVRAQRLTDRQAAYLDQMGQVETANPDSERSFAEGRAAVGAAFQPTGDAELDLSFDRFRTIQDAEALNRVRGRQEAVRRDVVRGSYQSAVTTARTALGQSVASAGVSDEGAALVGASLTQFAEQAARFGPREAFSIGGIQFAADPTRAGVVRAEELEQLFGQTQAEVRVNWIVGAAERAPDAASKRAFAGQVQERWAAGDPMFAGLDAADMGRLSARLDATAEAAAQGERAAMNGYAAQARDLVEAAEWGSQVDLNEAYALAEASGDAALMARIDYRRTYGFDMSPSELRAGQTGGLDSLVQAITRVESGGRTGLISRDPDGAGPAGGGAYGVMQLLPETAERVARRLGMPFDAEKLRTDRAYNTRLGTAYLQELMGRYDGNEFLAVTAYHAGPGNVDGWLRSIGDPRAGGITEQAWLGEVERRGNPRSAAYPRAVMAALAAQRRSAEGYASDPVQHARPTSNRAGLTAVAEVDINAPFNGGDVAAWGTGLRNRIDAMGALARRDGVPFRILDNDEAAGYKDQIDRDPGAAVALARAAVGSPLGVEGARELFRELGRAGVASSDLRLGMLSTLPRLGGVVRLALEGRQLRAAGTKPADFGDGETIADAARAYAPALADQPGVLAAVQSVAEDMALADHARGALQPANSYLNSALGATNENGARYGGLASINGGVTVAPSWLRADSLDDVLDVMARGWALNGNGPVYANGEAIPARVIQGYRMRVGPSGQYRLVNPRTGYDVPGRSGGAFEFDLDRPALRQRLRQVAPGSVLSGVQ